MPHKRAKRTIRELEQGKRGVDLPPSSSVSVAHESVPKSLTRVLDAVNIRKSYKDKRRNDDVLEEERAAKRGRKTDAEGGAQTEIKPGESLVHFNRRVEDEMRTTIAGAMHASRNRAKRAKKLGSKADTLGKPTPSDPTVTNPPSAPSNPGHTRKTEFDPRPSARRLNDVVQAPPSFTKLPRGSNKVNDKINGKPTAAHKTEGVVSMAQQQRMEEERERAISRYRELRDSRPTGGAT